MFAHPLAVAVRGFGVGVYARATRGLLRLPDLEGGTPHYAELEDLSLSGVFEEHEMVATMNPEISVVGELGMDPLYYADVHDVSYVGDVGADDLYLSELDADDYVGVVTPDDGGAC